MTSLQSLAWRPLRSTVRSRDINNGIINFFTIVLRAKTWSETWRFFSVANVNVTRNPNRNQLRLMIATHHLWGTFSTDSGWKTLNGHDMRMVLAMYCENCNACGTEIVGNSAFATMSTYFKRESLKKHCHSSIHKKCRDKYVVFVNPGLIDRASRF